MARRDSAGIGGYIEMALSYGRLAFQGIHVGIGSKSQKTQKRIPARRKIRSTKPL